MRAAKKDAILQIRMTNDLKEQLQKLAVEYGLPMSSLVIYAIAQFIRTHKKMDPFISEMAGLLADKVNQLVKES